MRWGHFRNHLTGPLGAEEAGAGLGERQQLGWLPPRWRLATKGLVDGDALQDGFRCHLVRWQRNHYCVGSQWAREASARGDLRTVSETTTAVELRGVTKRFGDVVAVDDIDLTVADGEFFSLLGPSGCGKTTTLRISRPNPMLARTSMCGKRA